MTLKQTSLRSFPTKKVLAAAKRDAATLELERLQQSGQRFLPNPAGIKAPGVDPKLRYVGGKNAWGSGGSIRSHIGIQEFFFLKVLVFFW